MIFILQVMLQNVYEKVAYVTYGHKKRGSAESQPLLTLNLIP